MMVKKIMQDKFGSIVISVILGLGLAAMFRRACAGDSCVVIKPPDQKEVTDHVFKIEQSCFRYTPNVVPCKRVPKTT